VPQAKADPYPFLDVRALWSLGIDGNTVPYNFEFWNDYTQFCRKLASESNVIMRDCAARGGSIQNNLCYRSSSWIG
jgi:hypothetical protein